MPKVERGRPGQRDDPFPSLRVTASVITFQRVRVIEIYSDDVTRASGGPILRCRG